LGDGRLLGFLGSEGGKDGPALRLVRLRVDVCQRHRERVKLGVTSVDGGNVGQRLAMLAAACAVAAIAVAAAAASSLPNWAAPQIATVVAHKLMGAKTVKKFRPNAALTQKTLTGLASGLKQQLGTATA